MIPIKLICNITEITLLPFLLYIWCTFAEHRFWRKPFGDCFWICNIIKLVKMILKSLWYFAYLNYTLLLKLSFNNWYNYLIFMYEIPKCWVWIAVYKYEKKNYSNLFENTSEIGNNIGRLFFETSVTLFFENNIILVRLSSNSQV